MLLQPDRLPGGRLRDGFAAVASAVTPAPAVATIVTSGLGIGSWFIAIRQMNGPTMGASAVNTMSMGMGMGTPGPLGSFSFFIARWVPMMAAMMLPGAVPAVVNSARNSRRLLAGPEFIGSYLAVWTIVGLAIYTVYRPSGTSAAGAVVIAAGIYELTPLKRYFRRRCREKICSGLDFGLYCVGSSIELMLVPVALGLMSTAWMSVMTIPVVTQKLLPAKTPVDLAMAVAIVGLGILIVVSPSSVPGFLPPR